MKDIIKNYKTSIVGFLNIFIGCYLYYDNQTTFAIGFITTGLGLLLSKDAV